MSILLITSIILSCSSVLTIKTWNVCSYFVFPILLFWYGDDDAPSEAIIYQSFLQYPSSPPPVHNPTNKLCCLKTCCTVCLSTVWYILHHISIHGWQLSNILVIPYFLAQFCLMKGSYRLHNARIYTTQKPTHWQIHIPSAPPCLPVSC